MASKVTAMKKRCLLKCSSRVIAVEAPSWCGVPFSRGTMELQDVQGHQTTAGYVGMLQRSSLTTEGPRLCGD